MVFAFVADNLKVYPLRLVDNVLTYLQFSLVLTLCLFMNNPFCIRNNQKESVTPCYRTAFWNNICRRRKTEIIHYFDVLLTVHLSIVLAINQLNAQNLLL